MLAGRFESIEGIVFSVWLTEKSAATNFDINSNGASMEPDIHAIAGTSESSTAAANATMATSKSDAAHELQLNLLQVDFEELYQRHLCRHSQLGINILHLIAVLGIYFSIYSVVATAIHGLLPLLSGEQRLLLLTFLSVPYLTVLIFNVPISDFLTTLTCILFVVVCAVTLPMVPVWVHLPAIVMWHRFQLWSHKKYTHEKEISRFEARYRKWKRLFTLLAVYELPILLHYLVRGRRDWN